MGEEMITPTPNEREVSDAHAIMRVPRSENEIASFLASYRQEIEAEKHQTNLNNVANYQLQVEEQKERISTLEAALEKAEKALTCDALWAFDDKDGRPPYSLCAEWRDGRGSLTSGPNNCRILHESRKQALAAIREAKEGK